MARAGILYSHVAQAATALVAEGKNPTVDTVRAALGNTGSKSTIAPLLKRWKMEHQESILEADGGLPADLVQAVKGVYQKLQADVQHQLDQAQEAHRTELQTAIAQAQRLESEKKSLTDHQAALSAELTRTKEAFLDLQTEHHLANVSLAATQAENLGLQQRLADRAMEVTALNAQLSQARIQFEHYQEATARQRSEERQATEQRIARMEQEATGMQQRLVAQQSTLGQQEARLAHLTAENGQWQEAASAAREERRTLQAEHDQLSYRFKELRDANDRAKARLEVVESALTEARLALAAQEAQTRLLAEHLGDTQIAVERLDRERLELIRANADLGAQVARHAETVPLPDR